MPSEWCSLWADFISAGLPNPFLFSQHLKLEGPPSSVRLWNAPQSSLHLPPSPKSSSQPFLCLPLFFKVLLFFLILPYPSSKDSYTIDVGGSKEICQRWLSLPSSLVAGVSSELALSHPCLCKNPLPSVWFFLKIILSAWPNAVMHNQSRSFLSA